MDSALGRHFALGNYTLNGQYMLGEPFGLLNGGFWAVRATSIRQGRLTIVEGDLDTLKSRPYFWRINDVPTVPYSGVFYSRPPLTFHGSILCGQGSNSRRSTNLTGKEKGEPSICSHLRRRKEVI